jgi:hypothetical protein
MPKVNLERNTFVKGLITEASPLTFPENASIDEDNFLLERDGSRRRRNGMDFEAGYTLRDLALSLSDFKDTVITSYRWENVGNDPTVTIAVVQIGYRLYYFNGFEDILSANLINFSTFSSSLSAQYPLQYAAIDGKLIVVNQNLPEPRMIEYTGGTGFTVTSIDLNVRDIWGYDSGFAVDLRPAPGVYNSKHTYNLYNQGWPNENYRDKDDNQRFPHVHFFEQQGVYPSNADIWYYGQDVDTGDPEKLKYESELAKDKWFGTTPAPRGRFIIDLFSRSQSREDLSGTGLPIDYSEGGVTTIATYAGRIFYSGIVVTNANNEGDTAPRLGTLVVFSKVIENFSDLGKCHSTNDPTSSDISDLLPTDGGVIPIPEASRIYKLIPIGASLLVVAENGVWEIAGVDNSFRADEYIVRKISNIGAVNAQSIVNAEDMVYFWSRAGIYVVAPQEVTGRLAAQNITETTIQSFFINIPSVGRANAVGRYDSDARRISWLYNDSDDSNVYNGYTEINKYNRELTIDTTLGAFSTFTFGETATDSPYVAGYMPTGGFNITSYSQNVVHNGDQVQVNGEDVVITQDVRSQGESSTKYIAVKPNSTGNVEFTFSLFNDENFLDWKSDDTVGVDAPAYLITGYELFADTMRDKQIPYLTMHFEQTEDSFASSGTDLEAQRQSSCLVQAQWDFANSSVSGKFGTQFQAYRLSRFYTPSAAGPFDYGQSVVTTKSKLRGIGRAFSMRIDTEAGKDLHLYGWGIHAEGGNSV